MSDIVRYYDSEKNPQRGTFPFQPLSDITAEEWADLTPGQQASVDASGFWRKTKPRPAPTATKATPKDELKIVGLGTDGANDGPRTTFLTSDEEAVNG